MRIATEQDFDAVYSIYMEDAVNPYMRYEIMPKEEFGPAYEEFMRRDAFWVYEHDHKVIGMCSSNFGCARTAHVAELGTLAMAESYHGTGHSEKFMEEILTALREKGFKRIDLWAEADNLRALKFYEKMGFHQDARIPRYFKRANDNDYVDEIILSQWFER